MACTQKVSILSGMSTAALQAALAAAQQAYLDLSTGAKGESYSYTQGDGARAVTYSKANIPQLIALIKQLQMQLGLIRRTRQPLRFLF